MALNFANDWTTIEDAIKKIIDSFETEEGHRGPLFTSEQYMRIYTIVYNISQSRCEEAQSLYDNCKKMLDDYTSTKVLPSLRGKTKEVLLQELVKQWYNHKRLTVWLLKFFNYLERYFIPSKQLRSLKETSYSIFYELVYGEISDQIQGVVLSLIKKEREGEEIDQALVKNVLDIYIEMGEGSSKYYEKDFGEAMLDDTTASYFSKVNDDSSMMSINDYIREKVNEFSDQNEDRTSRFGRLYKITQEVHVVDYNLVPRLEDSHL